MLVGQPCSPPSPAPISPWTGKSPGPEPPSPPGPDSQAGPSAFYLLVPSTLSASQACMRPLGKQGAAPTVATILSRKPPSHSPVWKWVSQKWIPTNCYPGQHARVPRQSQDKQCMRHLLTKKGGSPPSEGSRAGVTGGHRGAVLKEAKDGLWGGGGTGVSYLRSNKYAF